MKKSTAHTIEYRRAMNRGKRVGPRDNFGYEKWSGPRRRYEYKIRDNYPIAWVPSLIRASKAGFEAGKRMRY